MLGLFLATQRINKTKTEGKMEQKSEEKKKYNTFKGRSIRKLKKIRREIREKNLMKDLQEFINQLR